MWEEVLFIFGSIPKSNFWRDFDVFLELAIFAYFNAIFIDFYAVKSFYLHLFCVISMFLRGRMLISKIWMLEEF